MDSLEEVPIQGQNPTITVAPVPTTARYTAGLRRYEQKNHLGNVLAVVTDKAIGQAPNANGQASYYLARVVQASGYYPFGWTMPGKKVEQGYRYGFNGQERDTEWRGGHALAFKYRIHDARLGKFLSVDPLAAEYPELTTYQFASNTPIEKVELEGLEGANVIGTVGVSYSAGPKMNNSLDVSFALGLAASDANGNGAEFAGQFNFRFSKDKSNELAVKMDYNLSLLLGAGQPEANMAGFGTNGLLSSQSPVAKDFNATAGIHRPTLAIEGNDFRGGGIGMYGELGEPANYNLQLRYGLGVGMSEEYVTNGRVQPVSGIIRRTREPVLSGGFDFGTGMASANISLLSATSEFSAKDGNFTNYRSQLDTRSKANVQLGIRTGFVGYGNSNPKSFELNGSFQLGGQDIYGGEDKLPRIYGASGSYSSENGVRGSVGIGVSSSSNQVETEN